MLFLIALILAAVFSWFCAKPLKKHPYIFYVAAIVVTVITVILTNTHLRGLPVFVTTYVIGLFSRGAFATALWCVVMWAGAFPNGSAPIKKLMPIRGELSIFAAILTLGHNIGFGMTYFVRLFTDAGRMNSEYIMASILTIIMLAIMLPLTVMSIPQVRKKMNAKLWKKIQRAAYAFYVLIYLHVMILSIPMAQAGRDGYLFNIVVYSVVFVGYAVCRVRKWLVVRKKTEKIHMVNVVTAAVFAVVLTTVTLSATSNKDEDSFAKNTAAVNSTVDIKANSAEITTDSANKKIDKSSKNSSSSGLSTDVSGEVKSADESNNESQANSQPVQEDASGNGASEGTQMAQQNIQHAAASPEIVTEAPSNPNNAAVPNQTEAQKPTTAAPVQDTPSYVYKNGTYSGTAYGYDGDITVKVTIENDVIKSISASSDESDLWYFDSAKSSVISQILSKQSSGVDAVSGATYTSKGIMSAVQKAIDSAKN